MIVGDNSSCWLALLYFDTFRRQEGHSAYKNLASAIPVGFPVEAFWRTRANL